MTAPSDGLVTGESTSYPVYEFSANWSDSESVSHRVGFEIRYRAESDQNQAPTAGSVEDAEAFLEAMAAWAWGTYEPAAGGTPASSVLAKITQSETTLYTGT
jgi:hypothetical protein